MTLRSTVTQDNDAIVCVRCCFVADTTSAACVCHAVVLVAVGCQFGSTAVDYLGDYSLNVCLVTDFVKIRLFDFG